ncbi:MAG: hypothetical protein P4M11_04735 [Candidatus Pacebacteria bacterium]|nr:hypothetical protein [Candidatus Paceibacterota bacterium]
MSKKTAKERFFDEKTLINMFRNRAGSPSKESTVPDPRAKPSFSSQKPLQDVLEYKQILSQKISEADIVEREERVLLEARIHEIQQVFSPRRAHPEIEPGHEGADAGRAIPQRSGEARP